jgi:hypothetical protein
LASAPKSAENQNQCIVRTLPPVNGARGQRACIYRGKFCELDVVAVVKMKVQFKPLYANTTRQIWQAGKSLAMANL